MANPLVWYRQKLSNRNFLAASIVVGAIPFILCLLFVVPNFNGDQEHGVVDVMAPLFGGLVFAILMGPYMSAFFHRIAQKHYDYSPLLMTLQIAIVCAIAWVFFAAYPVIFLAARAVIFLAAWAGALWALRASKPRDVLGYKKVVPTLVVIIVVFSAYVWSTEVVPEHPFPSHGSIELRNEWAKNVFGSDYDLIADFLRKSPAIKEDIGNIVKLAPSRAGVNRMLVGWLDSGWIELNLDLEGERGRGIVHVNYMPRHGRVDVVMDFDWMREGEKWQKPLNEKGELEKEQYSASISRDSIQIFNAAAANKDFQTVIQEYERGKKYNYGFYFVTDGGANSNIVSAFEAVGDKEKLFQYYLDTAKWYWGTKRKDKITATKSLATKALEIRPDSPDAKNLLKTVTENATGPDTKDGK